MNEVFFSVVIPVFNKEKWIANSIQSVLDQDFRSFELIIVNDASTDRSLDIVKKIKDDRIILLNRDKKGAGGYAARNLGVKASSASWIVFLDADDIMLSNHLAVFHENISLEKSNKNVLFYVNNYYKSIDGVKVKRFNKLSCGVSGRLSNLEQMSINDFVIMNNICVSRKIFLDLGGFPAGKYKSGGDVLFWLKLLVTLDYIYYDNRVTSIWLTEGSDITKQNKNFYFHEPVIDLNKNIIDILKAEEKKMVFKIFNRKVISRIVLKKNSGMNFTEDLKYLKVSVMNTKQLIRIIMLILPKRLHMFIYNNFN